MDLSCIVESDRPIWATLRKSGRNIGGRKERKEDTVAENDGIHLLTATSTPELTCSSRGKTQAAHGQPETDDGLFG